MSLRKSVLSKLSTDMHNDEEMEELESHDKVGSLERPINSKKLDNYSPLTGQNYFDDALEVDVYPDAKFRVYYSQPSPDSDGESTTFVFHLGAGYTGLSFGCLAKELRNVSNNKLGVLSFDARAHGKTKFDDEFQEYDLSLDNLTNDLVGLLIKIYGNNNVYNRKSKVILVGHSMGGSVCANAVDKINKESNCTVVGLCVLDAVEGTALEALPWMVSIVNNQPKKFDTLNSAIAWHLNNKIIRNEESARLSVPGMMIPSESKYIWRTDLLRTQSYWKDWFKDLSSKFINAKTAKLLILAGADRLDTPLMIAQMQGKFQLNVVQNVGHCLQEDDPKQVCHILYNFWLRNVGQSIDLSKIKKVGQN